MHKNYDILLCGTYAFMLLPLFSLLSLVEAFTDGWIFVDKYPYIFFAFQFFCYL
jgi:hypothetical protein